MVAVLSVPTGASYQQWHDPALVGLVDTVEVLAYIVFALPAGWAAERYSRKGVRVLGSLLGGAAYALLTFAETWTRPSVGLVVAVVIVAALGLELVISSGRPALR